MKDLATARAEEDVDAALDLRDELTQYLSGDPLRSLDRDLTRWIQTLVKARLQAQEVDWEVARWVARALDSLGDDPAASPLRAALPDIRRRAGLCTLCGRAVAGSRDVCGRCRPEAESPPRTPTGKKDRR